MQRATPGSPAGAVVRMDGVRFRWRGARAFSLAVDDFSLKAGESVLLVGPSGSGKSTFLSLLCGIVAPQAGRLDVLGTDTAQLSAAARDRFRAEHFGIIFQMFNLLPYALDPRQRAAPLELCAEAPRAGDARLFERGGGAAPACRASASTRPSSTGCRPRSLSVGQQQRVAAARALIGRPELIVADEPTSALDRDRQQAFLDLLFAEIAAAGASLIMVSHEPELGARFDRVLRLDEIAVAERSAAA